MQNYQTVLRQTGDTICGLSSLWSSLKPEQNFFDYCRDLGFDRDIDFGIDGCHGIRIGNRNAILSIYGPCIKIRNSLVNSQTNIFFSQYNSPVYIGSASPPG